MLEYVDQVHALYRQYIDEEPKSNFITVADASLYLSLAYNEFRKKVTEYDTGFFGETAFYTLSGATSLDLSITAPVLMGVTATTRLSQLISVSVPDPTTREPMSYFVCVSSPKNVSFNTEYTYYMRKSVLYFGTPISQEIRLDYIPVQSVDWTKSTTVAPREFIDELVEYHDIIALLAYQQYAIRDVRQSENITIALNKRWQDLHDYLSRGRVMEANKSMVLTADYDDGVWG